MLDPKDLPVGALAGRRYRRAIATYDQVMEIADEAKRMVLYEENIAARDRALKELYENEAKLK